MDVSFRNNRLQHAYQKSEIAIRRWGQAAGRKYIQRIEMLHAAKDFGDVQQVRSLRAHPLKGKRGGEWALDLTESWRLIVRPSKSGQEISVEEVSQHYGH
jgi:plasmid maintenance system killer protein